MIPPQYNPVQAEAKMQAIIRGWAMYKASEQQLAELRGIQATLQRLIDPDTRMAELRTVDGSQHTATSRS